MLIDNTGLVTSCASFSATKVSTLSNYVSVNVANILLVCSVIDVELVLSGCESSLCAERHAAFAAARDANAA